jgi:hypothetical protein
MMQVTTGKLNENPRRSRWMSPGKLPKGNPDLPSSHTTIPAKETTSPATTNHLPSEFKSIEVHPHIDDSRKRPRAGVGIRSRIRTSLRPAGTDRGDQALLRQLHEARRVFFAAAIAWLPASGNNIPVLNRRRGAMPIFSPDRALRAFLRETRPGHGRARRLSCR